jgi:hypothetical protein
MAYLYKSNGDRIRYCQLSDHARLGLGICKFDQKDVYWRYTPDGAPFDAKTIIDIFTRAWQMWAKVCGVKPHYADDPQRVNVDTRFGPIDGRYNILAWSEMPCGGTERLSQLFDSSEVWVDSAFPRQNQIDLLRVAAHEIGHAIGIPHIASGNLMEPYYDTSIREPQAGDVAEAVARYGKPEGGGPVNGGQTPRWVSIVLAILEIVAQVLSKLWGSGQSFRFDYDREKHEIVVKSVL